MQPRSPGKPVSREIKSPGKSSLQGNSFRGTFREQPSTSRNPTIPLGDKYGERYQMVLFKSHDFSRYLRGLFTRGRRAGGDIEACQTGLPHECTRVQFDTELSLTQQITCNMFLYNVIRESRIAHRARRIDIRGRCLWRTAWPGSRLHAARAGQPHPALHGTRQRSLSQSGRCATMFSNSRVVRISSVQPSRVGLRSM